MNADTKETASSIVRDIHRIGGAAIENLRLKPQEAALTPPGISVLRFDSPAEAARQIREAFPRAKALSDAARIVASSNSELIRGVGFDIINAPTRALPNHCRLIHPANVAGFNDQNLAALAAAFTETTGHEP